MDANEVFGWVWVLMGMFSGAALGMRFLETDWLGGYSDHRRRLLRLGHISFFGLGILNILFAGTASRQGLIGHWVGAASVLFIVGGVAMPICCALVAFRPRLHAVFGLPVLSLLGAVSLLIMELLT